MINLFKSLEIQEFKNFEVIIIDQNPKEFLKIIISKWEKKLNIIYKNVSTKISTFIIIRDEGDDTLKSEDEKNILFFQNPKKIFFMKNYAIVFIQ